MDRRKLLGQAAGLAVLASWPARLGAETAMSEASAKLEVIWTVEAAALKLAYRVQNTGLGRIVVFDRMFWRDEAGRRIYDDKFALVSFTSEGGVFVDKLVPPIPDEIDVMNPYMPQGRLVASGAVLEGVAVLGLPLKPEIAYMSNGVLPKVSSAAVFRIGVAAFPDRWTGEPPFSKVALPGDEEGVLMRHAWASVHQKVLTSAPNALSVPIAQPKG